MLSRSALKSRSRSTGKRLGGTLVICGGGRLPDEVRLRRSKRHFDAVVQGALAGPELGAVRSLLGADAQLGAYLDLEAVWNSLLRLPPPSDPSGRQRWVVPLWRLVTAECWLRSQADAGFCERTRAALPGTVYEIVDG